MKGANIYAHGREHDTCAYYKKRFKAFAALYRSFRNASLEEGDTDYTVGDESFKYEVQNASRDWHDINIKVFFRGVEIKHPDADHVEEVQAVD